MKRVEGRLWRYLSTKYIQKLGMIDNGGLSGIHPSRILDIDMFNNTSLHKILGFHIEATYSKLILLDYFVGLILLAMYLFFYLLLNLSFSPLPSSLKMMNTVRWNQVKDVRERLLILG